MRWIVVGAGSGGCVAARRLHDSGHDVVVVEAGPQLAPGSVPAGIDGDDSFAAANEPGRIHDDVVATRSPGTDRGRYLRGRGVGGSSAVNFMVALVGDHDLYRSWGWDDSEALVRRILVPFQRPTLDELGRVDRLLLDATPDAAIVPLTRHGGRRITAAEAYLWPCLSSPRMRIVTDQVVDAVSFDGSGVAATGVRLATGERIAADAVVIAAGAIHTPAILLRSEVRAPGVGEHLQDHPAVGLTLKFAHHDDSTPRTSLGLATATTVDVDPIQMLGLNHLGASGPADLGMLMVALMRPAGDHGRVRLSSEDPRAAPIVEFDLLRDAEDVERLARGVRAAIELVCQPPFSTVVEGVLIDAHGGGLDRVLDEADLRRWMRTTGADYVHASSSCSRSVAGDGSVLGHEGLFVCDASAFPSIPNTNTHVPTMLLAERFSALWLAR
jgi:choline dehydrogenase-like flavoprotein